MSSLGEFSPVDLNILQNCSCILVTLIIFPLREKLGPLFKQTRFIFTQESFVSSMVEIGPMVLKKMKM